MGDIRVSVRFGIFFDFVLFTCSLIDNFVYMDGSLVSVPHDLRENCQIDHLIKFLNTHVKFQTIFFSFVTRIPNN